MTKQIPNPSNMYTGLNFGSISLTNIALKAIEKPEMQTIANCYAALYVSIAPKVRSL